MADTWPLAPRLRPRSRSEEMEASLDAPLRPLARPDGLAPDEEAEATALADAETRPRTRPEGLGTLPEETQEAATIAEAIPLDETALIGLFNGPDGGTALVRLATGSIVRVSPGETLEGARVLAINEDGLRLQRGGRQVVLTMPG